MANEHITRRAAGQAIISAAAAAYLAPAALGAQPAQKKKPAAPAAPATQPAAQPSASNTNGVDITRLLTQGKRNDWTLRGEVNVESFVREARDRKREMPEVQEFNFTSAAIIFPLLKNSASHRVWDSELKSRVRWDQNVLVEAPSEMRDNYVCGTRLGRWDLRPPQGKKLTGRKMQLEVEISMSSWRTIFDEKTAERVGWPQGPWGPVAASTFTDLQRLGNVSLVDHTSEVVQSLVRRWCSDKDPKSIGPVALAKFLAGNVLEHIQPSGNGLNFADTGLLEGLDLTGSNDALRTQRGTDQDVVCALAAVYRAAGLPARTVIGFDVADDKGSKENFLKRQRDVPQFRSWVEFCLYDESSKKEVWIPVDITRQRRSSSRILANPNQWRFFGSNDELDLVCPFAFQFHPPTTVVAHGSISFWGWITFPETAKATQYLRFNAQTTPRTKNTDRNRELEDERANAPAPATPGTPAKPTPQPGRRP